MPDQTNSDDMANASQYGSFCQKDVLTISQKKITVCQLVLSLFLAFIFTLSVNSQESLPDVNSELNDKNLNLWKEYIFSDADKSKRLNLAYKIAVRYQRKSDWAGSIRACLEYMKAFVKKEEKQERQKLQNLIGYNVNFLIMQQAKKEDFDIYQLFIQDNKNTQDGITGIKMLTAYYTNVRKWDTAAALWEYFKPQFPDYQDLFDKTLKLLKSEDQEVIIRNFGKNVNSIQSEWDPNLSPDGKTIFFSAQRNGGFGQADIWYSEKKNGEWNKPVNLGNSINSAYNETIDNISPDGNTLFISGDFQGTFGKFDIYTASKTENGWGKLKHFPMPINSEYQDEACNLTADGNALIFSSDRKGSVGEFLPYGRIKNGSDMGNMDIWVSEKNEDGSWGEPINLGEKINTPYAERAPFLHPDGKTLYFSSNARYGLGKLDVYKSTRLSDTSWTEWSEPVNLGKSLNTVEDDWGYVINQSGDSAVFAARNRTMGYGNWDLYSVSLPDNVKPEKICVINGFVKDVNGKPISTEIIWEDLNQKKVIGRTSSDPQSGKYFISLPLGKFYGYFAQKEGYYPVSNNVNLKNAKNGASYRVDITLVSIEDLKNDETITLNNLFFDYDESSLKDESVPELKRIADFLNQNEDLNINIEGHTDNQGTPEYNQRLSEARALAVKNYLIQLGIDESRLNYVGYGDKRPAFANTGESNMSKNRRVEIRISD